MKGKISLFLISLFVALASGTLTSCKSSASVPASSQIETHRQTTERIEIKDTTFQTKPDSSHATATVDIVDGNFILKLDQAKQGDYLKAPKLTLNGNSIRCDCEAEKQEFAAQIMNKYMSEALTTFYTPAPVEIEKKLSRWQEVQIYAGWLLFGELLAVILYLIFKRKFS